MCLSIFGEISVYTFLADFAGQSANQTDCVMDFDFGIAEMKRSRNNVEMKYIIELVFLNSLCSCSLFEFLSNEKASGRQS